jgi:serpin B
VDEAELSTDNLRFAFGLYPGVATDETSNVFYSPYSVSLALAMTYAGAANATAAQIATAMQFALPPAQLHPAFDALDLALRSRATSGVSLDIADSLWGDQTLSLLTPFLDTLAVDYGAGLRVTDFIDAPATARAAINDWVSGETEKMIANLLPPSAVTARTRLVLVNAVYFHASWLTQFDPSQTKAAPFTRLDGSVVQASAMTNPALPCSFTSSASYQAVELEYANKTTSMVVILPRAGQFAAVEKGLTGDFVGSLLSNLTPVDSPSVTLPKFSIHSATFSVARQLQALGMTDAFDPDKADFTAMTSPQPPGFSLSDVVQQAVVEVSESGTKAAAATAVVVGGEDDGWSPPAPVVVDRPFFFVIRDIPSNTALFVGRVLDPTQ